VKAIDLFPLHVVCIVFGFQLFLVINSFMPYYNLLATFGDTVAVVMVMVVSAVFHNL
jgi:hypothetical protein